MVSPIKTYTRRKQQQRRTIVTSINQSDILQVVYGGGRPGLPSLEQYCLYFPRSYSNMYRLPSFTVPKELFLLLL